MNLFSTLTNYLCTGGIELIDTTTSLTQLADAFKSQINSAAPIILGVLGVSAGLNIGIKLFKKVASKVS